jgi:hypothetical protein
MKDCFGSEVHPVCPAKALAKENKQIPDHNIRQAYRADMKGKYIQIRKRMRSDHKITRIGKLLGGRS